MLVEGKGGQATGGMEPPIRVAPKLGLTARLRAYFLAGVLVTAPVAITFYLAWLFISFIDSRVSRILPPRFNPETYLPFSVPGLGVVIVLVTLIVIGFTAAGVIGRIYARTAERIVARIPAVRSIYSASKQIVETVLANQRNAFREVVLIEFPRPGAWVLAFITGATAGEIQSLADDDILNVFVPTTPNPTSGFLVFVPRRDAIVLTMTVEEGIKLIVSGGLVSPPDRRPAEQRRLPSGPVPGPMIEPEVPVSRNVGT